MRTKNLFLFFIILTMLYPILGFGLKEKMFGKKPETKMEKYKRVRKEKPAPRSLMKENASTDTHIRDSIKPIAILQGSAGLFEIKTENASRFVLDVYGSENLTQQDKQVLEKVQTELHSKKYHNLFDYLKKELDANNFKEGYHVEIFGLTSETGKRLNGEAGTLKSFNYQRERWTVQIGEEEKDIKPANLKRFFGILSKKNKLDNLNLFDTILAIAMKNEKGNDRLKQASELATDANTDLPLLCNQLFVEVQMTNADLQTYFFRALQNNCWKCVKTIVAGNAWKTSREILNTLLIRNPLFEIAYKEFPYDPTKMCNTLLENGMKSYIEVKREELTPLMKAAETNKPSLINCLIKHGAQIDAKDKFDFSALGHAVTHQNIDACQILLENKADVEQRQGSRTAINLAIDKAVGPHRRGKLGCLQLLLKHNANVNAQNETGIFTLLPNLHLATEYHVFEQGKHKPSGKICKILLEKGVNLNDLAPHQNPEHSSIYKELMKVNFQEITPLMRAIILRNDECRNLILSYEPNLEVESGRFTPHYFNGSKIQEYKKKYGSFQKAEYYANLEKLDWKNIVDQQYGSESKKKFLRIYQRTYPKNAYPKHQPLEKLQI